MSRYQKEVAPKLDNLKSFPEFQAKVLETIEYLEKTTAQQGVDLELKLPCSQFDEVKCQMQRFALYDDYHALYDKVIPPLKHIETSFQATMNEFEQIREIIRRYDENLQLRALKTELTPIVKEFRSYVKLSKYKKFESEV